MFVSRQTAKNLCTLITALVVSHSSYCYFFFFFPSLCSRLSTMVHEMCVDMPSEAVTNKVVTLKAIVDLCDVLKRLFLFCQDVCYFCIFLMTEFYNETNNHQVVIAWQLFGVICATVYIYKLSIFRCHYPTLQTEDFFFFFVFAWKTVALFLLHIQPKAMFLCHPHTHACSDNNKCNRLSLCFFLSPL